MRAAGLRIAAIGLHLHRVDQVGKLDRVLDEEHWDVVADQIPIAFTRVELDGEAAHVARGIDRTRSARDGREADEHFGLLALGEHRGLRQVRNVVGRLEIAVRARPAGVDDPLGDALMVEMEDLLAQHEILEQRRPALARAQAVLVVGDRHAVVGGQHGIALAGLLVGLARVAADCLGGGGHLMSPGKISCAVDKRASAPIQKTSRSRNDPAADSFRRNRNIVPKARLASAGKGIVQAVDHGARSRRLAHGRSEQICDRFARIAMVDRNLHRGEVVGQCGQWLAEIVDDLGQVCVVVDRAQWTSPAANAMRSASGSDWT